MDFKFTFKCLMTYEASHVKFDGGRSREKKDVFIQRMSDNTMFTLQGNTDARI